MIARDLTAALGGRWHGRHGTARCVCHDDRTPSLKISDDPRKSDGVDLHCFSGCDWRDIKAELKRRGLIADTPRDPTPKRPERAPRPNVNKNRDLARQIWDASFALNPFTAAWLYLERRAIPLSSCASLRAHAELRHPSGVAFPALVCRVDDVGGHFLGIQRIYLTDDGEKAPVRRGQAKLALGTIGGGHCEITKGDGRTIYIAEGVEDAATAALACPWETVWAGLGSNIKSVVFPSECRRVVICPDADAPGENAAQALAARLTRESRAVIIARPLAKDLNAARMAEAAE